jgi:hypothetical protein
VLGWKTLPWLARTGASKVIESGIAKRIASKLSPAVSRLFKNPDIGNVTGTNRIPANAQELMDHYGVGKAVAKAGNQLEKARNYILLDPNLRGLTVKVPREMSLPNDPMRYLVIEDRPMSDALNVLKVYREGGYLPSGSPRGGIQSSPNRDLANQTRAAILTALRNGGPKGGQAAKMFMSSNRDYGVAKVMQDIFGNQGAGVNLFDQHQAIADRAFKEDIASHLDNLVGPKDADAFRQSIAPGRQVVKSGEAGTHLSAHAGPMMRAGIRLPFTFGGPKAPSQFMPPWVKALPIATATGVENLSDFIQGKR